MLKKIIVFFAASSFSLLLILAVSVTIIATTITPNRVKSWLRHSDVYTTIVDDIIRQSKTLNKSNAGSSPLDDPGIQDAAKKSFTPSFLQSSAEQIIDGTAPWLKGNAPRPAFQVDLTGVKGTFADNVGAYATTRYAALLACALGQAPANADVLSITCRPAGFDPAPEIQKAVNDLKNSKDFLGTTTITPDTLSKDNNGDSRPIEERLKIVPKVYRAIQIAPLVLGGLALLDGLIVVFASSTKRKGLRRIVGSLWSTGIALGVEVALGAYGLKKAQDKLAGDATINPSLQRTLNSLLRAASNDFLRVTMICTAVIVGAAFLITVYLLATRSKKPAAELPKEHMSEEPTPDPVEDISPEYRDHQQKSSPKE